MYLGAHVLLARRLRRAPRGALPARHLPRPLSPDVRRLPRGAARPEPQARLQTSGFISPATTGSSRSTPTGSTRNGPPGLPAHDHHRNPARESLLRRFVRRELGQPRTVRRRHHLRADSVPREEIPLHRRRLGTIPLRRLDRRLGGAGGPDLLSQGIQRMLDRLPRPDRLPRLHGRRHLQGQERLSRRRTVAATPRPGSATISDTFPRRSKRRTGTSSSSAPRAAPGSSGISGRPSTRPSGPTAIPSRSGTRRPASSTTRSRRYWKEHYDLTHILKRDWPKIGKELEGKINIYVGDMDNYYLNNAVYLMEDFLKKTNNPPYGGEVLYGDEPSTAGTAIPRAQRHQPPALSPDVPAEDRRSESGSPPARRRPKELGLLALTVPVDRLAERPARRSSRRISAMQVHQRRPSPRDHD